MYDVDQTNSLRLADMCLSILSQHCVKNMSIHSKTRISFCYIKMKKKKQRCLYFLWWDNERASQVKILPKLFHITLNDFYFKIETAFQPYKLVQVTLYDVYYVLLFLPQTEVNMRPIFVYSVFLWIPTSFLSLSWNT